VNRISLPFLDWMNYNDLTLTSLGMVVTERNRPQIGFISAMFRANDHPLRAAPMSQDEVFRANVQAKGRANGGSLWPKI